MQKWSESPYYPKNKLVDVYIGIEHVEGFDIIEESAAYKDYVLSQSKKSYVEWLEDQYDSIKRYFHEVIYIENRRPNQNEIEPA